MYVKTIAKEHPKYNSKQPKYTRSIVEVYPRCSRSTAEHYGRRTRPKYSQSVYCKCTLAIGALVKIPPCPSRVAAAVRGLHRGCRAALAHHCCRAALASLLLWRSRVRRCCCGALASLPPWGSCIPRCPSSGGYGFVDRCEAAHTQACWLDVACASVCGDHL